MLQYSFSSLNFSNYFSTFVSMCKDKDILQKVLNVVEIFGYSNYFANTHTPGIV